MLRISRGVGRSDLAPLLPLSEAVSSRMMSLHSSMHSSQMNTEGPAMSFLTSCWLLPQNEQYSSFSPEEVFSDMRFGSAYPVWVIRVCLCRALGPRAQHLVDDPVLYRGIGRQEVVAIGVLRNRINVLARVLREDLVQAMAQEQDFLGV